MTLDEFRQLPEDELHKILCNFLSDVIEPMGIELLEVITAYHEQEVKPGYSIGTGPMFQFYNLIVREYIKKL